MRIAVPLGWALPAAVSALAASSVSFSHHDWELACDNTGTCRVAGYQADDDEHPVSVLLERAAGAGAPVRGQVRVGYYDDEPFAEGADPAVTLLVDGVAAGRVPMPDAVGTLSSAQVAAILPVLAGTGTIAFAADDGRRWTLSPQGSTAVLLKMDDAQGRVGTRGALVRPGTRDDAAVPAPVPVPVVRVPALPPTTADDITRVSGSGTLRGALAASLAADDECFDLLDPEADAGPLDVVRLDEHRLLVSHRCWLAAYNAGSGYWVVDDAPPWNPVAVTTMGTDFADGTITASHKGRGLGDCWSHAAWSWDGLRFVPTAEATTGQCKLVAPGGAWSLPTRVVEVVPAGGAGS